MQDEQNPTKPVETPIIVQKGETLLASSNLSSVVLLIFGRERKNPTAIFSSFVVSQQEVEAAYDSQPRQNTPSLGQMKANCEESFTRTQQMLCAKLCFPLQAHLGQTPCSFLYPHGEMLSRRSTSSCLNLRVKFRISEREEYEEMCEHINWKN